MNTSAAPPKVNTTSALQLGSSTGAAVVVAQSPSSPSSTKLRSPVIQPNPPPSQPPQGVVSQTLSSLRTTTVTPQMTSRSSGYLQANNGAHFSSSPTKSPGGKNLMNASAGGREQTSVCTFQTPSSAPFGTRAVAKGQAPQVRQNQQGQGKASSEACGLKPTTAIQSPRNMTRASASVSRSALSLVQRWVAWRLSAMFVHRHRLIQSARLIHEELRDFNQRIARRGLSHREYYALCLTTQNRWFQITADLCLEAKDGGRRLCLNEAVHRQRMCNREIDERRICFPLQEAWERARIAQEEMDNRQSFPMIFSSCLELQPGNFFHSEFYGRCHTTKLEAFSRCRLRFAMFSEQLEMISPEERRKRVQLEKDEYLVRVTSIHKRVEHLGDVRLEQLTSFERRLREDLQTQRLAHLQKLTQLHRTFLRAMLTDGRHRGSEREQRLEVQRSEEAARQQIEAANHYYWSFTSLHQLQAAERAARQGSFPTGSRGDGPTSIEHQEGMERRALYASIVSIRVQALLFGGDPRCPIIVVANNCEGRPVDTYSEPGERQRILTLEASQRQAMCSVFIQSLFDHFLIPHERVERARVIDSEGESRRSLRHAMEKDVDYWCCVREPVRRRKIYFDWFRGAMFLILYDKLLMVKEEERTARDFLVAIERLQQVFYRERLQLLAAEDVQRRFLIRAIFEFLCTPQSRKRKPSAGKS